MKSIRYTTAMLLSVVAVVYLVYAVRVFPIPGTDSSSFLPPALTFAQGKGLANPIYYLSFITDATGNQLYNYYVPFYSWFMGFCVAAVPGIKTIFVTGALLTITALLAYRRVLIRNHPPNAGRLYTAAVLLSFPYFATYSLPTIGRPEQLTAPLLLALWLLYRKKEGLATWLYNALLVALFAVLLTTQVTGFYFAFLAFLVIEFLQPCDARRLLAINTGRGLAALLLFYLIMEVSPNGFKATMDGINLHSRLHFRRSDRSPALLAYYWLVSPFNVGFLVVFAACVRYWYMYIRGALPGATMLQKWIVAGLHLAIIAGIFRFVLHAAPTVYNLTQYIYVLVLFLMLSYHKYGGTRHNSLILKSLTLTFLAGTLLFLRTFILFADNEMDGRSYDAARKKLAEVERKYGRVTTHANLWSLYDDPYKVVAIRKRFMYPPNATTQQGGIVVMPHADSVEDLPVNEILNPGGTRDEKKYYHIVFPGDIVVVPQTYKDIPKKLLDRSEILVDWRTTTVRTFMHIPIARHPYGYSFVVLRVK